MFQERPNRVGWELRAAFLLAGVALLAGILLDIHGLRTGPWMGRLRTAVHIGWDFLYAAIAACGIWIALIGKLPQRKKSG